MTRAAKVPKDTVSIQTTVAPEVHAWYTILAAKRGIDRIRLYRFAFTFVMSNPDAFYEFLRSHYYAPNAATKRD